MQVIIPGYPVPFWRLFLKMGGWVVLVLGVILLIVTLISQSSFNTAQRFDAEGRATVALVRDKETTISVDSDGDRSTTYWLTLEYVANGGEVVNIRRSVTAAEYRGANKGEVVGLTYLAGETDRVELTPGSNRKSARAGQAVALILGAFWLVALWITGRWAVEAVRARRFGAREEAEVIEIRRTGVRVNNRPRYRLVWRDGAGREGTSLLRRERDLDGLMPGDRVPVYQGLKRSWWVGDVGERPGDG